MALFGRAELAAAIAESNRVSATDFSACLVDAGIDPVEAFGLGYSFARDDPESGTRAAAVAAAFVAGLELGIRCARRVDGDRVDRCAACGMDRDYHGADMHEFVPRVG